MSSKPTKKDWLDGLAEELKPPLTSPPKGYYSAEQVAERLGYSVRHTRDLLKKQGVKPIKVRIPGSIAVFYYGV